MMSHVANVGNATDVDAGEEIVAVDVADGEPGRTEMLAQNSAKFIPSVYFAVGLLNAVASSGSVALRSM